MKQNANTAATIPPAALLSNGRLHVAVTAAGTGQARRDWIALNRWIADPVEDTLGFFIYLRDMDTGATWSAGSTPCGTTGPRYDASSEGGRFTITRLDHDIAAAVEIAVSPSDDVEFRRLRLRDTSGRRRRIEVTSYIEIALNHPAADAAHPAFSKLFVQTEAIPDSRLLLARRRPRANDESWPSLFHGIVGGNNLSWETDRLRFLGRGRGPDRPLALQPDSRLSGTEGNVLDPVFSLRTTLDIAAGASADVGLFLGTADDRDAVLAAAAGMSAKDGIQAAFDAADAAERHLIDRLAITAADAALFQAVGVAILRGDRALRAPHFKLDPDSDINASLARLGIPADRPLVVAPAGWSHPTTARMLQARAYWAAKGLHTNLAILDEQSAAKPPGLDDRVFALAPKDSAALAATAHFFAANDLPSVGYPPSRTDGNHASAQVKPAAGAPPPEDLRFWNGYGGFSPDGSEYVIPIPWHGSAHTALPLPWINVIANEHCGFLVSESGAGYTWCRNSQANRLTPWANDPVSDPHGEALYVRDETDGAFWSPLPGPAPAPCHYEARHGFGYSVFSCVHRGLAHETTMFVPRHAPFKCVRLRISNLADTRRSLSLFSYARLLMASVPSTAPAIVTRHHSEHGLLTATNCAATEFRGGVAFSAWTVPDASPISRHFTCDRLAFIGPDGNAGRPAALTHAAPLEGSAGAGLDPCFAHQIRIQIEPGQSIECVLILGECMSEADAATHAARFSHATAVEEALRETRAFWQSFTSAIRVETPSPAIDLMLNGWLLFQNLSCRIWGRSAFYQSGGAYGYRDQLQDTAALAAIRPDITRAQILLHARHQFPEGDVLHWWHPEPMETGLRTRFADDLLWLPFVAAHYVHSTGDASVLDEIQPFVSAPLLQPGQDEVFLKPSLASESADVYEHCCRAIDRSLTRGSHGLPLMGTGDWNDGMNRIGREGRGESVWLGFFLHNVLDAFLPICDRRGDKARCDTYRAFRSQLAAALNETGWDGAWYRRAFYDDGTPIGSRTNDECRIDALAQAWAVISGVASPDRAALALDALDRELISDSDGIIRLLTPPFANTPKDPGYIKGYVAGVRENGGQYTHAACWVIRAFAENGRHDRAVSLLEMLLPITRSRTRQAADIYKVEPYVVAADVYGEPPHVGRGGWTWYTGSAGWMYRVALESILGMQIEDGKRLRIQPRIPDHWSGFRIDYRTPAGATFSISVENPKRQPRRIVAAEIDGRPLPTEHASACIPIDGTGSHSIKIVLGDR